MKPAPMPMFAPLSLLAVIALESHVFEPKEVMTIVPSLTAAGFRALSMPNPPPLSMFDVVPVLTVWPELPMYPLVTKEPDPI